MILSGTLVAAFALGSSIGMALMWMIGRGALSRQSGLIRQLEVAVGDLDRRLHAESREHARQLTELDRDHAEVLKRERVAAYDEGRKLGLTEGQREHIAHLNTQEMEFAKRLRDARSQAAEEARDEARRVFEQQAKLFSVEVRPFYEVVEHSVYWRSKLEERVGYQYQLLVNGIPAFQPHTIIESVDRRDRSKDDNIEKLAEKAGRAAQAAIETYLGGAAGGFVKLGKLIRRIPAKHLQSS